MIKCSYCGEETNIVYHPLMKISNPPVVRFTCANCFNDFETRTNDALKYDKIIESVLEIKYASETQLKVFLHSNPQKRYIVDRIKIKKEN